MKKIALLAIAAAAVMGTSVASAQEVTYVEDCAQGVLLNRNVDNWFITAQGGANMMFGWKDKHAELKNRIGAQAGLYVGKWVTPTFGFRFGASWMISRGATSRDGMFREEGSAPIKDGVWYPERYMSVGPQFEVLINLTNWWCGYKPNRVYNAVVHGGAGAYWNFNREFKNANTTERKWNSVHNTVLFASLGLQNNFRVAKNFDLFIDVAGKLVDFSMPIEDYQPHYYAEANLGFTYHFGKSEWNCPVTAVCPTWKYTDAEGDALVARLAQAEAKIKDLQRQLDDCLNRPQPKQVDCEGLVTIYYPINEYTLSSRDKLVLNSVAEIMQNHPNRRYLLTGWADNYTGTDEINVALRHNRVNGVKDYLIGQGVNGGQLDATIDNGELYDLGIKAAPLDRAVTIRNAE